MVSSVAIPSPSAHKQATVANQPARLAYVRDCTFAWYNNYTEPTETKPEFPLPPSPPASKKADHTIYLLDCKLRLYSSTQSYPVLFKLEKN